MNVLVINAGSSSLKYQLIDMSTEEPLAVGNCERIGIGNGVITHTVNGTKEKIEKDLPSHQEALESVLNLLVDGEKAVIASLSEISAVGHRLVHGAELYTKSTLVTDETLEKVDTVSEFAPLHNPPGIMGIKACRNILGKDVPQVMVFDTSFHQTMPAKAYTYPIPYELYEKYSIRRYGFHGTSHRYVSLKLASVTGKSLEDLKVVTCHLGNGSSITAVDGGKSIDTTMGFTPLEGIIMGTRCGSIDPSIVTVIQEKENLSSKEVNDLLNKESGYLGVSGVTSDQRDLAQAASEGNERADLALNIQRYQIKKQIGAYAAAMGGLDYIIFTGGIGENDNDVREEVCSNLEFLGVKIDEEKNAVTRGELTDLTAPGASVGVYVIPTNEELMIARDTKAIVSGENNL